MPPAKQTATKTKSDTPVEPDAAAADVDKSESALASADSQPPASEPKKPGDTVRWSQPDYYSPTGEMVTRYGVVTGVVDRDAQGEPLEVAVLEVAWMQGGEAAIAADQVE